MLRLIWQQLYHKLSMIIDEEFSQFARRISPNLKMVVYCTAIRFGGQVEWDFAWQRYLETNVGSEKDLLHHALGCTRETWLLSRYLDWTITNNSGIRKQDVSRVLNSIASNPVGQPLAFNFLRNKWARLRE